MAAQEDKQKTIEKLRDQILGQNLTSKWSGQGHGSAAANATNMAQILNGIGVTDIKQFGKVPQYTEAFITGKNADGTPVYGKNGYSPIGSFDSETGTTTVAGWEPAVIPVDTSEVIFKDGAAVVKEGEKFGNKETGQIVPNTYSERQTGNFWGGTFAGKGNTGYGVQFDAQGNPYFYTQGASSSDLGDLAPLLAVASIIPSPLQPFAIAANSAIALDQGDILGAIAGAAGLGGMTEVSNAARMGKALQSGDPLAIALSGANLGGITDVGGVDLKDISSGIGAVKAIESGDPLAMLRYGMGAMPKDGGLTSNLGPGTPEEFSEGLIPGYFQPGGEGYIPPAETPTGPGYYDEITGTFVPDENGGLQGPLGPETGNFDPNQKWEYSLTRPGVWTNDAGEEIDLSYMPDQDTAMTGAELMERAGAMPGGAKSPTAKSTTGAPAKSPTAAPTKTSGTTGAIGNALAGAAGALGAGAAGTALPGMAQQQTSNADLLNLLSSQDKGANIKSFKELFGEGLFGDSYVPPSAGGSQASAEHQGGSGTASQSEGDEQFFGGGHVDDFDVDALLRILRS